MKLYIPRFLIANLCFLLAGCADPLTSLLRDNHYRTIVPISDGHCVGDTYPTDDINSDQPLVKMHLIDPNQSDALMKSLKQTITLPQNNNSTRYEISANADILKYAKVDLQYSNITQFSVTISNATQYVLPKSIMEDQLLSKIAQAAKSPEGYIIYALLQSERIEYTFYDNSGGKISLTPGSELERILKAKLGGSWQSSPNGGLIAKEPRFIGYRIAHVKLQKQPH